jgi:hypothetical protein
MWLLRWLGTPRARLVGIVVVAALGVFGLATTLLVGGGSGGEAHIVDADFTVRLNDERAPLDNGTDGVRTCVGSGVPGDTVAVFGEVGVASPDGSEATVVVSLEHTEETWTATVERGSRETVDVFWTLADDETLSVGETTPVTVELRADGRTRASTTRVVTVENASRSLDC